MSFVPISFVKDLEDRNGELQIENAALTRRLAEMELDMQLARRTTAKFSGASSKRLTGLPEAAQPSLSADAYSGSEEPATGPRQTRALFGSILIPADSAESFGPASPTTERLEGCSDDLSACNSRAASKSTSTAAQWMFRPPKGPLDSAPFCQSRCAMRIRSAPNRSATKTRHALQPFSIFSVSREVQAADGILYLELMDGRGWVFEAVPEVGTMCIRLSSMSGGCAAERGFEEGAAVPAAEPDVGDTPDRGLEAAPPSPLTSYS